MTSRIWAFAVLACLAAGAAVRSALVWDRLPATMATHFGLVGQPNGWGSREGFFALFAALSVGVAAFFLALPALVRILPPQIVNLPNRDYWLAPEQRDAGVRKLAGWAAWLAAGTLAFAFGILELTLRANLARGPLATGPAWALLGAYLAFATLWVAGLWRAFRRP